MVSSSYVSSDARSRLRADMYLQTTSRLLDKLSKTSKPASASSDLAGDLAPPSLATVQKLNELATAKLADILRKTAVSEKGWDGYEQAELIAARELLDRDTQSIQR